MLKNGQLLLEVLVGILILSFLSLIIFLIFNFLPEVINTIDESIIIYNLALNYKNILLGLSRTNYSLFEDLIYNQPYYLITTSSGYEIKIGKEIINEYGYYRWFELIDDSLIKVYLQTPNNFYNFPFSLVNIREKIFVQENWQIATTGVIRVEEISNQYLEKSANIEIDGQIRLSQ
ncbi:MAG: hypothetical protein NZ866_00195 [Patescibacteria group bacterium]|nr:hypothetical protein [Patescibacteria group bacterium]